jgi:hypothetical protein
VVAVAVMITLELLGLADLVEVLLVEIMQEQLILVVEEEVMSQEMQERAAVEL